MSKIPPVANPNPPPKATPTPIQAANNAKQPSTINNHTEGVDLHIFENLEYPHCSDVSKYEKVIKIGQGTFG